MRSSLRALVALPLFVVVAGCTVDSSDPAGSAGDHTEAAPDAASSIGTSRSPLVVEPLTSRGQGGFANGTQVLSGFCTGPFSSCATADVNGDGRADFVSFTTSYFVLTGARSTSIAVSVANADGTWAPPRSFGSHPFLASPEIGDVDGDGRDDVVLFGRSSGEVRVMRSTGATFAPAVSVLTGFCTGSEICKVGDFNGDGKADLARFLLDTVAGDAAGDVFVALSTGPGFAAPTRWATDLGHAGDVIELGDVNDDRKVDVVRFLRRDGVANPVFVARSSGTAFNAPSQVVDDFCAPGSTCKLGNIDGGGRADIVAFRSPLREGTAGPDLSNDVYAALARLDLTATGMSYGPTRIRNDNFCPKDWTCLLADTDADGKDDLVAFSRTDAVAPGVVRVAKSTFGRRSTYVIDHERLGALSTEGTSDKPLLISLNFRTTFGVPGSTTVTSNAYNETWGTGLAVGERRAIPASVGDAVFTNVAAPTMDELISRRGQLEVVGSLVVAVEKDLSAADSWRALTEEAKVMLRGVLADTIERTRPVELAFNPARFQERVAAAANSAKDRVVPMIDEVVGLYLSGLFDPDDIIGFHLFLYPSVDKEAAALLPASPDPALVTIEPLGDRWGYWGSTADFRGGPIHWRMETRPRFASFSP